MANNNDNFENKIILAMAILNKAMEQVDSILKDNNSQRFVNWKTNLFTVHEDMSDYLKENIEIKE